MTLVLCFFRCGGCVPSAIGVSLREGFDALDDALAILYPVLDNAGMVFLERWLRINDMHESMASSLIILRSTPEEVMIKSSIHAASSPCRIIFSRSDH